MYIWCTISTDLYLRRNSLLYDFYEICIFSAQVTQMWLVQVEITLETGDKLKLKTLYISLYSYKEGVWALRPTIIQTQLCFVWSENLPTVILTFSIYKDMSFFHFMPSHIALNFIKSCTLSELFILVTVFSKSRSNSPLYLPLIWLHFTVVSLSVSAKWTLCVCVK